MSNYEERIAIILPHALSNLRRGVDPEALWDFYQKDFGKRFTMSVMNRAMKTLQVEGF